MATRQLTTIPRVRFVTPDRHANHITAATLADRAYADRQGAGASPEECSRTYHEAYARKMWVLGTPAPCGCPYCAWLTGEEPDDQEVDRAAALAQITAELEGRTIHDLLMVLVWLVAGAGAPMEVPGAH
jgi:hypothetical protein